jgi:hypothetical protein
MGWETRKRGTRYYTRSQREGSRVIRKYVGSGPLAELIARFDKLQRIQREEEAAYWKAERERLERNGRFLSELEEAVKTLTEAYLLASGCHRHKGTWRFKHERTA